MAAGTYIGFMDRLMMKIVFGVLAVGLLVWAAAPSARACTTPVFRYAMYNWPTAPYYVFYLHHGEATEEQTAKENAAINKKLNALHTAAPPTNVLIEEIDLSKENALERYPKVVREAYQKHAEGQQPLYLVYSPWGVEQFAGRLDEKAFQAMIDSPARKQLGKLFDEKSAAVLLILTGPDEKANKKAEEAVGKLLTMAAGGQIPVSRSEPFDPSEQPTAEKSDDAGTRDKKEDPEAPGPPAKDDPNKLKLTMLKVARTDAAEKWLVEMLMSVESDLQKYADEHPKEPMVFAVYGRGRAMPPFVGKGITPENLADCAVFLAGACSCQVKDQNPGMDLLMRWNWDKTAEKMAKDDPEFAGRPWEYEENSVDEAARKNAPAAADPPSNP